MKTQPKPIAKPIAYQYPRAKPEVVEKIIQLITTCEHAADLLAKMFEGQDLRGATPRNKPRKSYNHRG